MQSSHRAAIRPIVAAALVAVAVAGCFFSSPTTPPSGRPSGLASASAPPSIGVPSGSPVTGPSGGPSASAAVTPTSTAGGSGGAVTASPSIPPLAWHRVTAAGPAPSARSGHAWVVDPASAVAYLFGGRGTSGELGDLWAYDLTADAWHRLSPSGDAPRARHDAAAAWIDGLGLVLIGGRAGDRALADAWVYDPEANAWRTLGTEGSVPAARSGACVAMARDGRLWLFGGRRTDGTALADLWAYDSGPSRWTRQAPAAAGPGARAESACWWAEDGRFAVHGGAGTSGSSRADTWAYSPAGTSGRWGRVATSADPRADGATAIRSDATIIVGGIGDGGAKRADAVAFEPRSLTMTTWAGPANGPSARSGAALVDDPEGERVVLFGGAGTGGPLDDLWALDPPAS